jgi:uncharacterized protein (DUF302 family)
MRKTGLITLVLLGTLALSSFSQEKVTHGNYYFSKTIHTTLDEATNRVKSTLKEEGFGIVSEMNMHKTLNKKLGKKIKPYRILGACHADFAWETIQKEENIGVFLPCKVILKEKGANKIEVVAVNPSKLLELPDNHYLLGLGEEVKESFLRALEKL